MTIRIFPKLEIPQTIAAGPGPGNTDPRILDAFANAGLADHMHGDVLRGMVESKIMLRQLWGTKNVHTFGVAGTGWSGLDTIFSAILPGDTVVAFTNGTFSGIDGLTLRIKAATREELAANALDPKPASVTIIDVPHGQPVTGEIVEAALKEHKPKWAFMAHWETGSGIINDISGFSEACQKYGAMGLVDAVSSLGVEDFAIDDYPGVSAWASCPQKGLCCLPLTYAPVSFRDDYIETLRTNGAYSFVHNPIFEARHWGIIDGQDVEKGTYHRTHSAYAVAAFHESLRLALNEGIDNRAKAYRSHEAVLREAVSLLGCDVTSTMSSLVVLNLPQQLAGREMELVQNCRGRNFGIWPTLSSPVQVRIGLLNLTNAKAVSQIIRLFAQAIEELGGDGKHEEIEALLDRHYGSKDNA
ncbi:MAG: aminotransferase class V-fold PLP-dependent enzyme [Cohaesibacter sp.]|nr:aminotransferase class V-fold PLP-dependent enzyme [Cohaesibacter sp.]